MRQSVMINNSFRKQSILPFVIALLISLPVSANKELTILNWSEYMDPDLIKKFEATTNIKVRMTYYESDDIRDDMLINTNGKGYDIVVTNGPGIKKYYKKNWLEKINHKAMPNIKYIAEKWRTAFSQSKEYAVPYFWGTTGIAYRKDLVKKQVTSWLDFFKPEPGLEGKLSAPKSSKDLIGMGLKALGYSANSESKTELKKVEKLLREQKKYMKNYIYMTLDNNSPLITGEIVMTLAYSGDALVLTELDENIKYIVPKEGGNIWVDYMVVTKKSTNKDNAWKFLNFINEPKHAAQLANFVYYATPNKQAEKYLSKDFLQDKIIYPPENILNKSEYYRSIHGNAKRFRNIIFGSIVR